VVAVRAKLASSPGEPAKCIVNGTSPSSFCAIAGLAPDVTARSRVGCSPAVISVCGQSSTVRHSTPASR
jgi:hypothetical protein